MSKRCVERLTLDMELRFWWGREWIDLPGVAVAEVKQQHASLASDFIDLMRPLGVRPMRFSKYCIGIAQLHPELKQNRFKPKLRRIQQVMEKESLT